MNQNSINKIRFSRIFVWVISRTGVVFIFHIQTRCTVCLNSSNMRNFFHYWFRFITEKSHRRIIYLFCILLIGHDSWVRFYYAEYEQWINDTKCNNSNLKTAKKVKTQIIIIKQQFLHKLWSNSFVDFVQQ